MFNQFAFSQNLCIINGNIPFTVLNESFHTCTALSCLKLCLCTPHGFQFIEQAQRTNARGVVIIYNNIFKCTRRNPTRVTQSLNISWVNSETPLLM